jgi:hypothetical protein
VVFGRFSGFFTVLGCARFALGDSSAFAGSLVLTGCGAAGPGSVSGVRFKPAPENPPGAGIRAGITVTFGV